MIDKRYKLYRTLCQRLKPYDIQLNVFNSWQQIWFDGPCFWYGITEDNAQEIEDLTIEYFINLRNLLNE